MRCMCDYVSTWCADGWEVDKNIVYVVSIILFVRYECRFVFVTGRIHCQPAHEPDVAAGWQCESAAWQRLIETGGREVVFEVVGAERTRAFILEKMVCGGYLKDIFLLIVILGHRIRFGKTEHQRVYARFIHLHKLNLIF